MICHREIASLLSKNLENESNFTLFLKRGRVVLADEICMSFFARVLYHKVSFNSRRYIPLLHKNTLNVLNISRAMSNQVELFKSIGLADQKAKETAKNKNLADRLEKLITTTVSMVFFF